MGRKTVWAEYGSFSVDSERNKFYLKVSDYRSNSTTSVNVFIPNNGQYFTTRDRMNHRGRDNCAIKVTGGHGGGWWYPSYNLCGRVYPTAPIGKKDDQRPLKIVFAPNRLRFWPEYHICVKEHQKSNISTLIHCTSASHWVYLVT